VLRRAESYSAFDPRARLITEAEGYGTVIQSDADHAGPLRAVCIPEQPRG